MKIISYLKPIITLLVVCIALISCGDKGVGVVDVPYPDQTIYMPAAVQGIFKINSVAGPIGNTPVPGYPYRYLIDSANKKFNIPLSVYRAGVNNKGSFSVSISLNTDTISKLKAMGGLPDSAILLPANEYQIDTSVMMEDGKELAPFNLSIDIDSLRKNINKIYVMGISISSNSRKSNPKFSTTIIVIDTKIIKPTADFTYNIDGTDSLKANFTNKSLFAVSYIWSFGDGTDINTEVTTSHTYASAGTYTVTLTAIGITGNEDKSIKNAVITIP